MTRKRFFLQITDETPSLSAQPTSGNSSGEHQNQLSNGFPLKPKPSAAVSMLPCPKSRPSRSRGPGGHSHSPLQTRQEESFRNPFTAKTAGTNYRPPWPLHHPAAHQKQSPAAFPRAGQLSVRCWRRGQPRF